MSHDDVILGTPIQSFNTRLSSRNLRKKISRQFVSTTKFPKFYFHKQFFEHSTVSFFGYIFTPFLKVASPIEEYKDGSGQ